MYSPPTTPPEPSGDHDTPQIKPTDLRGILRYVPMFRGQTFVIAVDGSIVADENFSNVLLDVAVLRSLNIKVVLVHGIGRQLKNLSESRNLPITEAYGDGPTDAATLQLAMEASGEVSGAILGQLTQLGMTSVLGNTIRVTEMGILSGVDQQHTGKIDRLEPAFFERLLNEEIIPLVSPIAYSRVGHALRVNSDILAAALAVTLKASKLIFLTPHAGLSIDGNSLLNLPVAELEATLSTNSERVHPPLLSKARQAVQALHGGVPRVHILDGRVFGGLLIEIFDKVGLGTMIHSNEYQRIRPARRKDAQAIHAIIRNASRSEMLRYRSKQSVEDAINHFFVYEIDGSLIGCACLSPFEGGKVIELNSVFVQTFYQGRGVGRKLIQFAVHEASRQGANRLIALSTQSFAYFQKVCGFREGSLEDLPAERVEIYQRENRKSKILVLDL